MHRMTPSESIPLISWTCIRSIEGSNHFGRALGSMLPPKQATASLLSPAIVTFFNSSYRAFEVLAWTCCVTALLPPGVNSCFYNVIRRASWPRNKRDGIVASGAILDLRQTGPAYFPPGIFDAGAALSATVDHACQQAALVSLIASY